MTLAYSGLLEHRVSGLGLLKSTFNAENFTCGLSQFTVEMCAAAKNCKKIHQNPLFKGSSISFKVIDVDKSKKLATSACYDMQQVCTYLQPFSHYGSQ